MSTSVTDNMYNIQFKVKYNDIQQELIEKINTAVSTNTMHTCQYTCSDVELICTELYVHELGEVVGIGNSYVRTKLEDITPEQILKAIKKLQIPVLTHAQFSKLIALVIPYICKYDDTLITSGNTDSISQYCHTHAIMFLFSMQMFYLIHECIYQIQTNTNNIIDNELIIKITNIINKTFT